MHSAGKKRLKVPYNVSGCPTHLHIYQWMDGAAGHGAKYWHGQGCRKIKNCREATTTSCLGYLINSQ